MDVTSLVQTVAIYSLPVLFAITLHEAAHGYVARHFGDLTAHAQGRISLNPLRHIAPANGTTRVWFEVTLRDGLGYPVAGEVVRLGRRLVDVAGPDGGGARTSLRRDDTGAGACEIILVDSLETLAG